MFSINGWIFSSLGLIYSLEKGKVENLNECIIIYKCEDFHQHNQ